MTTETQRYDATLAAINDDTIDHHCFGCGNANSHGLKLRFRPLPDGGVWADFTPSPDHEDYLGMTHGGILATVADEAMSWAVTHAGDLGVTARMSIAFRRPARLGEPLRVEASIVGRRTRTIETRAVIRDRATGELLLEADGRFVRVSKSQAAAWREAYGEQLEGTTFGAAALRNAGAEAGMMPAVSDRDEMPVETVRRAPVSLANRHRDRGRRG